MRDLASGFFRLGVEELTSKDKEELIDFFGREALNLAFKYLAKARKAYVKNDEDYVEYLGRALHYI